MKVSPAALQAALQAAVNGDVENLIATTTPGGIEEQEANGQKSFVAMQTLPKECPKEDLEKLGFVFGEDADDIFVSVQFPDGWTKKATDHSMHSDLLDDKGRKRAGIFYKAAFYDRSASMYLTQRYTSNQNYDLKDAIQHIVFDCGEAIYKTNLVNVEQYSNEYWKISSVSEREAKEWLNSNYPEYSDPTKYWN